MSISIELFKTFNQEQRNEYGKSIPLGETYDTNSKILTFKNSNGFWSEYTRDTKGNVLTYKDSHGISRTYQQETKEQTFINELKELINKYEV